MIAQVIVDVAAKQTDRLFEYNVPADLGKVEIGARVVVPFGKRKLQGFVVGLSQQSQFSGKLKDLQLVIDEMPPLTQELVELSADLAEQIFAYRITILQAMLPRVMRANYRKILVPLTAEAEKLPLFAHQPVELTDKLTAVQTKQINQLLRSQQVKVEYAVDNQAKARTEKMLAQTLSKQEYQALIAQQRANATKRIQLLELLTNADLFPISAKALRDAYQISSSVINDFANNGWIKQYEEETYRDPFKQASLPIDQEVELTTEQQLALGQITQAIKANNDQTFLLEGVTGSGKTEVYLHAISQALQLGKTALMLVPEISLTPQMVSRVRARFGQQIAVLHSQLSEGERYDEWRRIRRAEAKVVVGARSAIFSPLENIGVIIIDEEHESTYKQEDNPRYHAREVALLRAKVNSCPLILGSATPSIESRARAQKGLYQLLTLTKRAKQNQLPQVSILDLKDVTFAGEQVDLSEQLVDQLQDRLAKHEQSILMLNRRGFANFMLCRECGFVLKCPNCDLSLTMHKQQALMICHYCGHSEAIPQVCPHCQSEKIRFLGSGTQKIEQELKNLLPQARIVRMDIDTTRKKGAYEEILTAFGKQEYDILLGTQMIAKGLDFPNVTFVGVINADTGLWLPDYNASERTFELLTQVAGRSGRADKPGEVLIQTYNPEHYALRFAQNQDYEGFYRYEMRMRRQGNYPPYFYTVLISISSVNEQAAAKQAFAVQRLLLKELHEPTIVLGPTPRAISRLKNQYYYQILVKYKHEPNLNRLLHKIEDDAQAIKKNGIHVFIDVSPQRIS